MVDVRRVRAIADAAHEIQTGHRAKPLLANVLEVSLFVPCMRHAVLVRPVSVSTQLNATRRDGGIAGMRREPRRWLSRSNPDAR
jgi:hypothetical protein